MSSFRAFKTDASFNEHLNISNIAVVDLINGDKNIEKIKIDSVNQAEISAIQKAIDLCLESDFVLVCNDNQNAVDKMRQKYAQNSRIQIIWLPRGFNKIADKLTKNNDNKTKISAFNVILSQIKFIKLKLKNNEKISIDELKLLKNEIQNIKNIKNTLSKKKLKKFKKLKNAFKDICEKIVENSLNNFSSQRSVIQEEVKIDFKSNIICLENKMLELEKEILNKIKPNKNKWIEMQNEIVKINKDKSALSNENKIILKNLNIKWNEILRLRKTML